MTVLPHHRSEDDRSRPIPTVSNKILWVVLADEDFPSGFSANAQVYGIRRRYALNTLIPKRTQIETSEQIFARAEKDCRNSKMQFINQTRAQVLLDRRHAAADPNVFAIGGIPRLAKSGFDAVCDEMKRRATVQDRKRPPVMG